MIEFITPFEAESLRPSEVVEEIRQTESLARRIRSWVQARLGGDTTADPEIVVSEPLPLIEDQVDTAIATQETAPVIPLETKDALLSDFNTWLKKHANDGYDRDNVGIIEAFGQMFVHLPAVIARMSSIQRLVMPPREVISAIIWEVMPNRTGPYHALVQQLARSGVMARLEKYVLQQLGRKVPDEHKLS